MIFKKENISVNVISSTWEESIQKAGQHLVLSESCSKNYVSAMIEAVHELGPYIVVAPGVALAHARPSADVYRNDISAIVLKNNINFGHDENDPVKIVFAFCACEKESHMDLISYLGDCISDCKVLNDLMSVKTEDEFLFLINKGKG